MLIKEGKVFILGDNVDTDQILPGYAMSVPTESLKDYALKGSAIENFPEMVKEGDIIIAGKNFGCGSSREQAAVAIKDSGVSAVIALNYARIFRRNAINIGLPVMEIDNIKDIIKFMDQGDIFEIDIENAILKNKSKNKEYQLKKLSNITLETIKAGGLINKVKNILKKGGVVVNE